MDWWIQPHPQQLPMGWLFWSPAGVCKFIPCNVLCRSCRKLRHRDSLMPLSSVRPNTDALHLLILQMIVLNKGVDFNPELSDWNWVIGVFFLLLLVRAKVLFFFFKSSYRHPCWSRSVWIWVSGLPVTVLLPLPSDRSVTPKCLLPLTILERKLASVMFFSMTNILHIVKHGVCVYEEFY